MKALTITAFLLSAIYCQAQQVIEVINRPREMSKGTNTAFVVDIPQANFKLVESLWKNYVNDRPLGVWLGTAAKQVGNVFRSADNKVATERLRIEKIKDELYLRGITNEDLTQNKLDIYAKVAQMQSSCQLAAFFQFTDSVFIGEENVSPEMFQNLRSYIREFGVEAYRETVKEELKAAEDNLKDKERELKKLESKRKDYEKSINKNETDISDAESELRYMEGQMKDQDDKLNNLKTERRQYNKKSADYESVNEQLKQENKNKKELISSVKKNKNRISKYKSRINSEESKIRQNLDQQEVQQNIISDQQKIVDEIEAKLKNIK